MVAFPSTSVLDSFTDASSPRVLSSYNGTVWGYLAASTEELSTTGSAARDTGGAGGDYRKDVSHADTEVFLTLAAVPTSGSCSLYVRLQNPTSATLMTAYSLQVTSGGFAVFRVSSGQTNLISFLQPVANGDMVGLRVVGTTISAYYKSVSSTWLLLGSVTDSGLSGVGTIGVSTADAGVVVDDFGGGAPTVSLTPTDTGLSISDSLTRVRQRSISDSGLSMSDSIARVVGRSVTVTSVGLSVSDSLLGVRHRVRSLVSTGVVVSDSLLRGPITEANHITIEIPYVEGSYVSARLLDFLESITPAHLAVSVGYDSGFLVGVSLVGVDGI